MEPLELALDGIAAYRLTRLITRDVITRPLRARVIARSYGYAFNSASIPGEYAKAPDNQRRRFQELEWERMVPNDDAPPRLAKLVTCQWCVGIYVGAAVAFARWRWPRAWGFAARALTAASAAALIPGLERHD